MAVSQPQSAAFDQNSNDPHDAVAVGCNLNFYLSLLMVQYQTCHTIERDAISCCLISITTADHNNGDVDDAHRWLSAEQHGDDDDDPR